MRLRATIAYDGTGYQGWQAQAGRGPTIQETVERALSVVLRQPVRVAAAGRTDAGVHARGQVIAFDVAGDVTREVARETVREVAGGVGGEVATGGGGRVAASAVAGPRRRGALEGLLRSVNGVLPPDIVFCELAVAPPGFDPRRDATLRAYRYRIWNCAVRSPFAARTAWHVRSPLDTAAMQSAASHVEGEHDFASFQGADHVPRPSVRRVVRSEVTRSGELVTYAIEANAFARHMVRNLVGELVEVGLGRRRPEGMVALLAARDRRLAAPPAPPHGLVLEWVRYGQPTGRATALDNDTCGG